eukprot:6175496-Pleurochrysis_carterae.AAC.2
MRAPERGPWIQPLPVLNHNHPVAGAALEAHLESQLPSQLNCRANAQKLLSFLCPACVAAFDVGASVASSVVAMVPLDVRAARWAGSH